MKRRALMFRLLCWLALLTAATTGLAVLATCSREFSHTAGGTGNTISVESVTPESGANTEDTLLTIDGANFSGTIQVYVGSMACTAVAAISGNILSATVPAGIAAGVYDIVVMSDDGGNGILQAAFTVVDPTLLSLTSVTPDKAVNDTETTVTFAGENFVAPMTAALGENLLVSVAVADTTSVTAIVPAGIAAGIYDVIVTNPDGTTATITEGFEVIDSEAIRIDSIDPTSGSNAEDTIVTLIGANFVDPVKVYLGAEALTDPAPIYQSSTRVVATVPAGLTPGVYDVKAENPDGQFYVLESAYEVTESDDDTTDDDVTDDTTDDTSSDDDDTETW